MIADRGTKTYQSGAGVPLAVRHITFKQGAANAVAHTFFCLHEDRLRPNEARPDLELAAGIQPGWSFRERVRMVRHGIRNLGQRVLETVLISATPMDDGAAEQRFEQLLREVVVEEK